MSEHVILVALTIEAPTREGAEIYLSRRLHDLHNQHAGIESWWVAEDDRRDGSDNDSAVFVDPTKQREAESVLRAAGLASGQGLGFPWSGMNVRCIEDGCDNDMSELMCPNDRRSCLDHCGEDHDL